MAANTVSLTDIDEELQKAADAIFQLEGKTASDVYRTLLRITVAEKHTPGALFRPNAETLEAMQELEAGGGESFNSIEALMTELHADRLDRPRGSGKTLSVSFEAHTIPL